MPKTKKSKKGSKKASSKKDGEKSKKVQRKSEEKKKKEESIATLAQASIKLWQAKLEVTEKAKQTFKDNAKLMMLHNDTLQTQMIKSERDTIDVITYLKKKDQNKDDEIEKLQEELKIARKSFRLEKDNIVEQFSKQVNDLEDTVKQKQSELNNAMDELKLIKDFRMQRALMQEELEEIKESMVFANKEHKTSLQRIEQKFFEEKMRLQQEANQKIAELAEKAHSEAIADLDETSKSVYKQNVRLSKSLETYTAAHDALKVENDELHAKCKKLQEDKSGDNVVIQAKTKENLALKKKLSEVQEKVRILEKSLTHVVHEFDTERGQLVSTNAIESQSAKNELSELKRIIELKTKESNKIKRLAKNILEQRTEVEHFFMEALGYVRSHILANQKQYTHDAKLAYGKRMLEATDGKTDYPKIRTFTKSEKSTNDVFRDMEVAHKLQTSEERLDISELTWEQKERVLRYLFGLMNAGLKSQSMPKSLPLLPNPALMNDDQDKTFLTNQSMPENLNKHCRVPEISTIQEVDIP